MGKITDMIMASVLLNDGQGGGGYPEPSGSIDIVENGIFDVKDYAEANVDIDTSAVLFVDDEHPELRIKLAEPLAGGQHIGIAYKLFGASTTTDAFKIHINTVTKSMYGDDDVWKDFSLQASASMVGATEIVINQTKSGSKLYIYGVVTHGNGETVKLEAGDVVNTASLLMYDKIEAVAPEGLIDITDNGQYDVSKYSTAVVNVKGSGGITCIPLASENYFYLAFQDTDSREWFVAKAILDDASETLIATLGDGTELRWSLREHMRNTTKLFVADSYNNVALCMYDPDDMRYYHSMWVDYNTRQPALLEVSGEDWNDVFQLGMCSMRVGYTQMNQILSIAIDDKPAM